MSTRRESGSGLPSPVAASRSSELDREYGRFLEQFPEYQETLELDEIRAREFGRLDEQGQIYLDYTGGSLHSRAQILRHLSLLEETVMGNPHSSNPTSLITSELVEKCRKHVLNFFNASPEEYAVIFTANASHALKLVGESYPFGPGDRFLLTFDNHNSVNGIREYDRTRGARTIYVPVAPPDLRVDDGAIEEALQQTSPKGNNLFAYPAQSNFSGVQHPLEWIEKAQRRGWDVLLDAAAYVPTNPLDLSLWHPDFVALSFYKIFGYPTGVGALIGRRQSLSKLHRPWFAGGTITVASVQADRYFMASGETAFEDGTLNYTSLPAVDFGLDFIESVGLERIHRRVSCLARWVIERLSSLEHGNGRPLVRVFGPGAEKKRGATVALNFYDDEGRVIDHDEVEKAASRKGISLRTGCFCNPGAGEMALEISRKELLTCFSSSPEGMTYDDFRMCIDGKSTGAVRISMGVASNFADLFRFTQFAEQFRR